MATVEAYGVASDIAFGIRDGREAREGSYRWPTHWEVHLTQNGRRWRLSWERMALEEVADRKTGGFAMSVVSGELIKSDSSASRRFKRWEELLI